MPAFKVEITLGICYVLMYENIRLLSIHKGFKCSTNKSKRPEMHIPLCIPPRGDYKVDFSAMNASSFIRMI